MKTYLWSIVYWILAWLGVELVVYSYTGDWPRAQHEWALLLGALLLGVASGIRKSL